MSRDRAKFTQSDANRIAKAAATYRVAMRGEFLGPDGTKAIIYAGKSDELLAEMPSANDLDQWIAKNENETKGH
jgi:hypothetical protein